MGWSRRKMGKIVDQKNHTRLDSLPSPQVLTCIKVFGFCFLCVYFNKIQKDRPNMCVCVPVVAAMLKTKYIRWNILWWFALGAELPSPTHIDWVVMRLSVLLVYPVKHFEVKVELIKNIRQICKYKKQNSNRILRHRTVKKHTNSVFFSLN